MKAPQEVEELTSQFSFDYINQILPTDDNVCASKGRWISDGSLDEQGLNLGEFLRFFREPELSHGKKLYGNIQI